MSKSEFDDLLLKKLQDEELAYNPGNWDRLAQLLPPAIPQRNKHKGWAIGMGVAAALALLLSSVLWIRLKQQDQSLQQPAMRDHFVVKEQKDYRDSRHGASISDNASRQSAQAGQVAHPSNAAPMQSPLYAGHPSDGGAPGAYQSSPDPGNAPQLPAPDASSSHTEQPVIAREAVHSGDVDAAKQSSGYYNMPLMDNNAPSAGRYLPYRQQEKKNAKTSVAFGGGVNYGSLNAGYSLGITARQKLGDKFFVDGTVTVMYNNNVSQTANYQGPSPHTAARPAAYNQMAVSAPAIAPVTSLYYVQFNPSLGYQLDDNIALGIGGDLQQMLSNGDGEKIFLSSAQATKVFPVLDFGITGKTEFSITQQIQAGLIFREGLNNLIKNTAATPYVNRRYVQVQFKYTIPVK